MAALARKHRSYIVSPMDRKDGPPRLNSAVLLDRNGKVGRRAGGLAERPRG